MKNIRIWFKKDGACRYISHLDLNRVMLRALHKSKIPVWHTEGFNPHPFATFPLPLSLGFRGVNECMDVKLEDEDFSFKEIIDRLNACLPAGIRIFDVTEPLMKAGKVAFASFTMRISCDDVSSSVVTKQLRGLLDSEAITVEKKSKRGLKTVDIKPGIRSAEVREMLDCAVMDITLSAGSSDNVNPNLIITALQEQTGLIYDTDITRNDLYNAELASFR